MSNLQVLKKKPSGTNSYVVVLWNHLYKVRMLTVMITCHKIYFVFFIFTIYANYFYNENCCISSCMNMSCISIYANIHTCTIYCHACTIYRDASSTCHHAICTHSMQMCTCSMPTCIHSMPHAMCMHNKLTHIFAVFGHLVWMSIVSKLHTCNITVCEPHTGNTKQPQPNPSPSPSSALWNRLYRRHTVTIAKHMPYLAQACRH